MSLKNKLLDRVKGKGSNVFVKHTVLSRRVNVTSPNKINQTLDNSISSSKVDCGFESQRKLVKKETPKDSLSSNSDVKYTKNTNMGTYKVSKKLRKMLTRGDSSRNFKSFSKMRNKRAVSKVSIGDSSLGLAGQGSLREPRRKTESAINLPGLGAGLLMAKSKSIPRKLTEKEKQMEVYKNRLTLKSISPMRVNIIQSYKKTQKNYMKYLEVKTVLKKGLLDTAYQAYHTLNKAKESENSFSDCNISSNRNDSKRSKFIIMKSSKLIKKQTEIANELKFAKQVVKDLQPSNSTNSKTPQRRNAIVKNKNMLRIITQKQIKSNNEAGMPELGHKKSKSFYDSLYKLNAVNSTLPPRPGSRNVKVTKTRFKKYSDFEKRDPHADGNKTRASSMLRIRNQGGFSLTPISFKRRNNLLSNHALSSGLLNRTEKFMKKIGKGIQTSGLGFTKKFSDFSPTHIPSPSKTPIPPSPGKKRKSAFNSMMKVMKRAPGEKKAVGLGYRGTNQS